MAQAPFEYVFPAIRGVQARHEYYVSMCPLRLIPKLFLFNEEELVPELRAQRLLNRARIPEIGRYIVHNPDSYVFSAITTSIDADVTFTALQTEGEAARIGLLHVPMSARFIINDGQHRRAAIEMALRERPELADESIAVVFFIDVGLERCQQMFSDLNRHAVRPSRSIGVLYDHRDDRAEVARRVVGSLPVFKDTVEMERSTLSLRSRRLFTFSALYSATSALLQGLEIPKTSEKVELATSYWEAVSRQFPEWTRVQRSDLRASEVREDFIHSHGVVLQALGQVGNVLFRDHVDAWKRRVMKLKSINWARSNSKTWEGRALIGGRVSKGGTNVTLTANYIKRHLTLPLSPEEQRVEDAYRRGDHGRH